MPDSVQRPGPHCGLPVQDVHCGVRGGLSPAGFSTVAEWFLQEPQSQSDSELIRQSRQTTRTAAPTMMTGITKDSDMAFSQY